MSLAKLENTDNNKFWQGCEQQPSYLAARERCGRFGKQRGQFLLYDKTSYAKVLSKENGKLRSTWTWMFTELFLLSRGRKQAKHPSTQKLMNKHTHTRAHDSPSVKRRDRRHVPQQGLISRTWWQGERNLVSNVTHCAVPFISCCQEDKVTVMQNRLIAAGETVDGVWGWGSRNSRELCGGQWECSMFSVQTCRIDN